MTHPHLTELKRRHAHLSNEVESLQRAPGTDALAIATMKKQKLALKEEIFRMGG